MKGALCEEPVSISQPSFTTSVGGYSSYLAHAVDPAAVARAFEAQFHFSHADGHREQGREEMCQITSAVIEQGGQRSLKTEELVCLHMGWA